MYNMYRYVGSSAGKPVALNSSFYKPHCVERFEEENNNSALRQDFLH